MKSFRLFRVGIVPDHRQDGKKVVKGNHVSTLSFQNFQNIFSPPQFETLFISLDFFFFFSCRARLEIKLAKTCLCPCPSFIQYPVIHSMS